MPDGKRTSLSMAHLTKVVSNVHAKIESHIVSKVNQRVTEPQSGTMLVDLSIQVSGPLL